MSENTITAALRRMGFSADEMTAHGFRAMASTLLNESGKWSPDAIERALAHKDGDQVRAAYHRGAHWNERVAMAQWWSDHLDTLRGGAVVIPLTRSAGPRHIAERGRTLTGGPARTSQTRLILDDASEHLKRAVNDRIKARYAIPWRWGRLRTGPDIRAALARRASATIKAAVEAMEEEASKHITACVDRVAVVAKDLEAFAMIHENVEVTLAFLSKKLDGVISTRIRHHSYWAS